MTIRLKSLGVCTRDSLIAVLNTAKHQFDLIFVTGDLSMDGSVGSYKWLKKQLDDLKKPYRVLPGNHDNLINLQSTFNLRKNLIQIWFNVNIGNFYY